MSIKKYIIKGFFFLAIATGFTACGAGGGSVYDDNFVQNDIEYLQPTSAIEQSIYHISSSGENIIFAGDTSVAFEIYDERDIYLGRVLSGVSYISPGNYTIEVISLVPSFISPKVMIFQEKVKNHIPFIEENVIYDIQNRSAHLYKMDLEFLASLDIQNTYSKIEIFDEYLNSVDYENYDFLSDGMYYVLIKSDDLNTYGSYILDVVY